MLSFATGLRRSELAALDVDDVEFVEQGIIVEVWKSKTDQKATVARAKFFQEAEKKTCPVRILKIWLEKHGATPGSLFTRLDDAAAPGQGITGGHVAEILKAAVERIGLDPSIYSGHYLSRRHDHAASSADVPDTAHHAAQRAEGHCYGTAVHAEHGSVCAGSAGGGCVTIGAESE
jgi:integrase